jgi:hypothetical protein
MANGYSDELRAAVVSALMTGQSVSSVAKEYNIPKGTVSAWKTRGVARVADVATQKANDEEIADLLLQYLKANLKALISQVELFGDKTWLKGKAASELSLLHGIQTDKAIRVLEAFSADSNSPPAEN